MKSTQYSEKVLDHFRNPRNVGVLEGDDVAKGKVGNPVCGDLMEIYIKVNNDIIKDIKLKTFGCGSAIATASMITEMAKGKTIEEASNISRQDVADELDGLPPIKMHCSNLAADALKDAIKNYHAKRHESEPQTRPDSENNKKTVIGEKEFHNKGVYHTIKSPLIFNDKRVMILDGDDRSLAMALELTSHTPRVVFVTSSKDISASPELTLKLKQSDVKILYESEILEIMGLNEVEKVRIHDLNEDEEYELFVDSLIIPDSP
jgi:FeS cluster assembly scaffold protein NifU